MSSYFFPLPPPCEANAMVMAAVKVVLPSWTLANRANVYVLATLEFKFTTCHNTKVPSLFKKLVV